MTKRQELENYYDKERKIVDCVKHNIPDNMRAEFFSRRMNSEYFHLVHSCIGEDCEMKLKSDGPSHLYHDKIYGVRLYFIHRSSHHETKEIRSLFCIRGKYYLRYDLEVPFIEDSKKVNMTDSDFEYLGDGRYRMDRSEDWAYRREFEQKHHYLC